MANLRSDDGFAWIARSVVIICGTAFLMVCSKSFFHWYTRFHVVGESWRVTTHSETSDELPQRFWKAYFHSKLTPGTMLRVNDLRAFQRELLQTGYFSNVELSIVDDVLKVDYALYKPLALVQEGGQDTPLIGCLYESGRLLSNLQDRSSLELCQLQLPKFDSEIEYQTLLQVISSMLKSLDFNTHMTLIKKRPASSSRFLDGSKTWWVKSIDATNWLGSECPCSEMILGFESPEGKVIWMRLGALRLEDVKWLEGASILQLLEIARSKEAIWIDARLEDLVAFKLPSI